MKINYQDERDDDAKRIPMRVQEFGNLNSIRRDRGWKHYYHFDTKISYKTVRRRLEKYVGMNVDAAYSDFLNWMKESHIDDTSENRSMFWREIEKKDEVNMWTRFYLDDGRVIRRHNRKKMLRNNLKYVNKGHEFLGFRIKDCIRNCPETWNLAISIFGKDVANDLYKGNIYVDSDSKYYKNDRNEDVVNLYNKIRHPERYYYCGRESTIWEAMHTPDQWEKLSKKEFAKKVALIKQNHKNEVRLSKKYKDNHGKDVYEKAMQIYEGKQKKEVAENLVNIERHGFTKDSFKSFGGQPNLPIK